MRVKDVTRGPMDCPVDNLINVNGTLFFAASGQLWKSDGTHSGTLPIRTIEGLETSRFFVLNDSLFFTGFDNEGMLSLWKSDGTEAGTVVVNLGSGTYAPRCLASIDGIHYFFTESSERDRELWRTDGTTQGTRRIKAGLPALTYEERSRPTDDSAIGIGGTLFFTVGGQLWKSDGTEAGTTGYPAPTLWVMGRRQHVVTKLASLNGALFFSADDGIHGMELWKFGDRDGDGDGLPDWWEDSFFTDGANPSDDPDGDGLSNWQESRAGTAPTDATSALRFTKIERAGPGAARLNWLSAPDQLYTLLRSAVLSTNVQDYQVIRQLLRATPPINSYLDTSATGPGPYFYRVRLTP